MKFKINKNELLKNLNINIKAVSGSVINEILKGIKIQVSKEKIILITSSSDLSIKTTINQNENNFTVEEEGEIVIANANYFTEIIKKLSGKEVDIELTSGGQIQITSDKADFSIPSRNSANYPNLPIVDDTKSIKIESSNLLKIIKETIKSAGVRDARPIFNGIHLVANNQFIKGITTDSHRLAQKIIYFNEPKEKISDINVVIPTHTLNELVPLLNSNETVKLQFDENYLVVDLNQTVVYSQLLIGDFPETDRLIPNETNTKISVEVKELLPVIERAHLAARQSNNITITFNLKENKLSISTRQSESGTFEEDVILKSYEGEDLLISMNPEFIKDAISSLAQEVVEFSFTGQLKPFTIRPNDSQDNNDLQLITPVRTINN
ncbi:MAG: DNA polymerase III subunit beta [Lactobacillaceae bacterium]|jgi:DNA polymerase-3 subunit beta|nr:DNA polymerase III subunit beta [Lactobacillaceae bacterium]